jgi:uncharacterized protein (DUF362 family)
VSDILHRRMSRRRFLIRAAEAGLATGAVGLTIGGILAQQKPSPWNHDLFHVPDKSSVAVLRATDYAGDLESVVMNGMREVGVDVRGKSVLLKPNMVEFDPSSAINTDPRLTAATAAVMKRLGARSVTVGEGPGHRRDTEYIIRRSGLLELLRDVDVPFVDLNTAALVRQQLQSHYTGLGELWLPKVVVDADFVVSMPKMKTHHWGGVTLSLKNCFGVVPGRVYGWPKNVLHWAGLEQSILDVAAAVRPDFAIVDGITGMQGDGPIEGTPIASGVIVMGADPVAVDATAARVMEVDPSRVFYLAEAGRFLGQAEPELITQVGEDPEREAVPFELLPSFAHLRVGSSNAGSSADPAHAAGG